MSFAFCRVSVSPIRGEQKDSSEMVSQLLFGELITVLKKENNWLFIETFLDKYQGWIDEKQIQYISKEVALDWAKNQKIITKDIKIKTNIGLINITKGAFLHKITPQKFNIDNFNIESNFIHTKTNLITFAKSFLNTPYLWGGKNSYGIDCSGFSQVVLRSQGIEIPRDASQQINLGIETTLNKAKQGDLAFFANAKGKIIHVGILLSKSQIIHASGRVKIDKIDQEGIWSEELKTYSHTLHSIKRML
jgi:cell wall-associated NlpC family hydrolase